MVAGPESLEILKRVLPVVKFFLIFATLHRVVVVHLFLKQLQGSFL
jgi:hypothetical protein